MSSLSTDSRFSTTGHLCPSCGELPLPDFGKAPRGFWDHDHQELTCESCHTRLYRNGAYGAPMGERDWKIATPGL